MSCGTFPHVVLPNSLDLAPVDADDTYAPSLNSFFGRSYAHQLPLMGTASRITGDSLVPFGYLIFYYVIQVGKGGAHHGGVLLDALGAVPVLAAEGIVVYEVGGARLPP